MTFFSDLQLGKEYEKKLASLLAFDTCEFAPERAFKAWDIKIVRGGVETYYEVKCDRRTNTTKNIVIEFECSGKPSGIDATQAHYWAYFIHGTNQYLLLPVEALRTAIQNQEYKNIVKGGDGYRARMYLFSLSTFSQYLHEF